MDKRNNTFRITILSLILFIIPSITLGALTDNFESYSNGDLNGQGSWSGHTAYDVQDSVALEGLKSIVITSGGDLQITKTFTADTDGIQRFKLRSTAITRDQLIILRTGATNITSVGIQSSNLIINRSGGQDTIQVASNNTTYTIDIKFNCNDDTVQARVDEGTWTTLATTQNACTNIDTLVIQSDPSASSQYYDDFQDFAEAGGGTPQLSTGTTTPTHIKTITLLSFFSFWNIIITSSFILWIWHLFTQRQT